MTGILLRLKLPEIAHSAAFFFTGRPTIVVSTLVAASPTIKADRSPLSWTVAETVLARSGSVKIIPGDALTTFRPVEGDE